MKRRAFLVNSVIAVPGLLVSRSAFSKIFDRPHTLTTFQSVDQDTLRELRSVFSNLDHAKTIGRAYLGTGQAVCRVDELAKRSGLQRRSPHTPMKEYIRERIRKDFSQGRTVIVNGWVLSMSEACVCALLTLA